MLPWKTLVFCLVAVLATVEAASTNQCPSYCRYKGEKTLEQSKLRIRKDVKCLTEEEWFAFGQAAQILHDEGAFDFYNYVHVQHFNAIHDSAQFFPWHRWLLYTFETKLRQINPSVTIPYWDGAPDFSSPGLSEVFNETRAGGPGDPYDGFCVKDGLVAGWIHRYPNVFCVQRNFGPYGRLSMPVWHSPEWVTHMLQTGTDYDKFREGIEFSLHALMHGNVGGPEGDLMWPWGINDILFFLLHANIDRIWAKWQMSNPTHYGDFGGPFRDATVRKVYRNATLEDKLWHFEVPVREALKFQEEPLLYTYDEFLQGESHPTTLAEERLRQLPTEFLAKYYPTFLSTNETSRFNVELPPVCGAESLKPMPYPASMNAAMLEARGFNSKRVLEVQEDSNNLVRTLNMLNYLSPYVQ